MAWNQGLLILTFWIQLNLVKGCFRIFLQERCYLGRMPFCLLGSKY